eukprot:4673527-Amphidinium_carterae.1
MFCSTRTSASKALCLRHRQRQAKSVNVEIIGMTGGPLALDVRLNLKLVLRRVPSCVKKNG